MLITGAQRTMSVKCIKAFISGRVQGVFFRDSTRQQALQLNITGYAINLADGRVEVLACGKEPQLSQLINWLRSGPEYAQVDDVTVQDITVMETTGFYIR